MLKFNEEKHSYTLNGNTLPGVTGSIDILCEHSKIPADVLMMAAIRGNKVHKACELLLWGQLDMDKVDEEIKPYVMAFGKFCDDYQFVAELVEHRVWHKRLLYAGTFDLMGSVVIRGKRIENSLIDIKATFKLMPSVGPQTAAYKEAYNSNIKTGKIKRRFALRLIKDGSYEFVEQKSNNDFNIFLSCLNVYKYLEQNK